jgi:IS5 family transposase
MRRKDGSDDDSSPDNWKGQPRSNDTHESSSDPESRLYRKSSAAPALPSYLGHVLTDNRHGLVVNVKASTAGGTAERDVAAQMLTDVAQRAKRVTVGADKAYDTKGFVKACRERNVTPHVARNGTHRRQRHRRTHHKARRLCGQPTQAKVHRAMLRLGQGDRPDPTSHGAGTGYGGPGS